MKNSIFLPEFEIHTTPLEKIFMNTYSIDITLDDINERRFKITAKPYQAFRSTCIDCLSSEDYYNEYSYRDGRYHRHVLLIEDSPIIAELRSGLVDTTASFLDDARHYVLPLQEILIDIITTNFTIVRDHDS